PSPQSDADEGQPEVGGIRWPCDLRAPGLSIRIPGPTRIHRSGWGGWSTQPAKPPDVLHQRRRSVRLQAIPSVTSGRSSFRERVVMPSLIMQSGDWPGKVFPLHRDEMVIGKRADCDIILPDQHVSKLHARIVRRHDDLYIENLENTNETKVNGML